MYHSFNPPKKKKVQSPFFSFILFFFSSPLLFCLSRCLPLPFFPDCIKKKFLRGAQVFIRHDGNERAADEMVVVGAGRRRHNDQLHVQADQLWWHAAAAAAASELCREEPGHV